MFYGWERERERDPIHWFPSQISRVAGAGSTKAGSWKLHLILFHGSKESNDLDHHTAF